MDALENKVIIYDDVCPLCKAYTGTFVRMGWLRRRTGFARANSGLLDRIDLDRARHEIPLHDLNTGETIYGLEALYWIIGNRLPVLRPLFQSRLFCALLKPVYGIVTYNRRIIAGSRPPAEGFDCAPDVNLFYRWLYLMLVGLSAVALLTNEILTVNTRFAVVGAAHLSILAVGLWFSRDRLTFLGHWATILLLASVGAYLMPAPLVAPLVAMGLSVWLWHRRWDLFQLTVSAT